ncbi:MAG TPA: hypothetical protein VGL27_16975 [Negativicutes bacterium]
MKKSLVMALAVSTVISVAGTAFAADAPKPGGFTFDGGIYNQYRIQRDSNNVSPTPDNTKTGFRTMFKLNANMNITDNLNFYARYTYENINVGTSINGKDFMSNTGGNYKYNNAIDAFGLKYNNAGIKYTIGSQPLTLGGGILYDNWYIGKHANPYAAKIEGKVGATNLMAVYAKTNYQDSIANDKFYSIQGNYNINRKATVGAMFAHVSYGNDTVTRMVFPYTSLNAFSVYGSYYLTDKLTASTEYLKTNAALDNKAYTLDLSYKIDPRNTFGIGYYRAEENTSIIDYNLYDMTATDNNNTKGWNFYWTNKLNKNLTLSVTDFIYTKINATSNTGGGSDRNRFTANLAVSF